MSHTPRTIRIKTLINEAELPFGGGLVVNPQTPPNAPDNKGDGLLLIDTDAFLLVG